MVCYRSLVETGTLDYLVLQFAVKGFAVWAGIGVREECIYRYRLYTHEGFHGGRVTGGHHQHGFRVDVRGVNRNHLTGEDLA